MENIPIFCLSVLASRKFQRKESPRWQTQHKQCSSQDLANDLHKVLVARALALRTSKL